MTYKNVEVINQEQHEKSWFHKFRNKLAGVGAVAGAVAVTAPVHAEIPDFIAPASTAINGIAFGLGALFLVALTITLTIIAFTNSKGGIKKAG